MYFFRQEIKERVYKTLGASLNFTIPCHLLIIKKKTNFNGLKLYMYVFKVIVKNSVKKEPLKLL